VLHQIGVGVLGPVFRAYEPARDRLVAVKVFRLDITPEQARQLADELERLVEHGLFHPSIVAPAGAGLEGGTAYLGADYVAAESLDVAMRHYAPAPLDRAVPFITQLAGAIDFAAASGVQHGTLHPRDIFVTPDEARATGFGVADALERLGLRAPVRRPYTAPERIAGAEWSTAADVFSLAAIAYELITGRRPTGTGDGIAPLPPDAGHHADALRRVLAKALADEPAARYRSALEFAADLEELAGLDASAPLDPAGLDADLDDDLSLHAEAEGMRAYDTADWRVSSNDDDDAGDVQDLREIYLSEGDETGADEAAATVPPGASVGRLQFDPEDEDLVAPEKGQLSTAFPRPDDQLRRERDSPDWELPPADADRPEVHLGSRLDPPRPATESDPAAADVDSSSGYLPAAAYEGYQREDEGDTAAAARDGARPRMLPIALALAVGLLAGFAAGYGLGSRPALWSGSGGPIAQQSTGPDPTAIDSTQQAVMPAAPEARSAIRESAPPDVAPVVPEEAAAVSEVAPAPPVRPPAPQPPSPAEGRLLIRSTPAGARVLVDGAARGTTPLTLRGLELGTYTVRVERDGYRPETRRVTISAARPAGSETFTLGEERPAAPVSFIGAVYVDSRPRGARVLLDGSPVGTTPMRMAEVSAGSHVVRIEQPGYVPWTASVRVVAGEETRVTASLNPDRRR
jgi:serine/threonine protein kinase